MKEITINLTKEENLKTPRISSGATVEKPVKIALSAFDVDNNGLDANEYMQAFDYFVNKEKEIAMTGEKGDYVLTDKDIEQIIKTDDKFKALRELCNDDTAAVDILSGVVGALNALVSTDNTWSVRGIGVYGITTFLQDSYGVLLTRISGKTVNETQYENKIVDGKQVKICREIENDYAKRSYVNDANDNSAYTDPKFVAKCLGYKIESTWCGLGKNKYYEDILNYQDFPKHRITVYECYRQYKEWDKDTNSFTNGRKILMDKGYESVRH